jgi:LuxR family maltose regulon positive regulatory protein
MSLAPRMTARRGISQGARFAQTKFQPPALPATLVRRPELDARLTAGAGRRLTVVIGSAGTGKSVLLSSWAAARSPGPTSWLSCDEADANPVRFWAGFVQASRAVAPDFGADAADLLATDRDMSADVIAAIADDVSRLPHGSAIVVDDFHHASATASRDMAGLIERWPAKTAQLVLTSRVDRSLGLHGLRADGELCELRDRDLYFSLTESHDLLTKFGVDLAPPNLGVLHQRSEGWPAAVQMAALSLRGVSDPARIARALDIRSRAIAEYFVSEVLEQQSPEVGQFMLDTSILDELTSATCAAVTGNPGAEALLRIADAASLFLVALDADRASLRYHHLVREILQAELHARDQAREQALHLRAAEWFEFRGDTRRATRHYVKARQADRALALMQDSVVTDFLRDPAQPGPLDLSAIDSSARADAPDRLLALATDLLLSGDLRHGTEYFNLLEQAHPVMPPDSRRAARFAVARALRYIQTGEASEAVSAALAARAIQEKTHLADEWTGTVPMILLRAYTMLEDFPAVEREAAATLAMPTATEPVRLITVPGARALAWFESGRLVEAAEVAGAAAADARRLGFDRHYFAIDYLRVLAALALEQRDLDKAEELAGQALSISEQGRPFYEFLTLLDRSAIFAARGHTRDALTTINTSRHVLTAASPALAARADELEAQIRLSLGDLRSPAELAGRLPGVRRELLLARIALASNDHDTAQACLQQLSDLTPRHRLERQVLLAAAAIERDDPRAATILSAALDIAWRYGFLNTVVTTAPQVTSHLIRQASRVETGFFTEQLTAAAMEVHATQHHCSRPDGVFAEPLTEAELRILKLLPTSTYQQTGSALYISRNTVKTHLRSIYRKLGVTSRSEAIERAVDLRLL